MNAIDTNVLIYRVDNRELIKQAKARALLSNLVSNPTRTVLFWQVLGEFARQLRYWQDQGRISRPSLLRYVSVVRRLFPLAMPVSGVLDRALDLAGRYSLSHWDSMIIGACLEANVDTLYTEDMGSPTTYDSVRLINPFI